MINIKTKEEDFPMKRKTMFTVQGIVSFIAVIVIGILSIFSPVHVAMYPSESTASELVEIAANSGDDSEEMKRWLENLATAMTGKAEDDEADPEEKEEAEAEEDVELLKKILQAEMDEAAEKAELELKVSAYEVASARLSKLQKKTDKSEEESLELEALQKKIPEMEKELDETFKGKKVAESTVLKRKAALREQGAKGFETAVPLLDFLTNVQGSINAVKLMSTYDSLDRLLALQSSSEDTLKSISELQEYLADKENYKGINPSALNVAMFLEELSVDSTGESSSEPNRYRVMYQAIYEEDPVMDSSAMSASAFCPVLCGAILYVVAVVYLLASAVVMLIVALRHIGNPEKLYGSAVRKFDNVGIFIGCLLASTVLCNGFLSVTGIIILVIAVVVFLFNGLSVRTGQWSKEENAWLNITQGTSILSAAGALTVALVLLAGNPLAFWNEGLLCLLQKGIKVSLANELYAWGLGVCGCFGILAYSLMAFANLSRTACIRDRKKGNVKVSGLRGNSGFWFLEGISVMIVLALLVMGMPVNNGAIAALIVSLALIALQVSGKILCRKTAGTLTKERIEELKSAAVFDGKESENSEAEETKLAA